MRDSSLHKLLGAKLSHQYFDFKQPLHAYIMFNKWFVVVVVQFFFPFFSCFQIFNWYTTEQL